MADPKLTKTRVVIAYTSDDKYSMTSEMRTGRGCFNPSTGAPLPPEGALLDGIEELARLCALFGFEDAARVRISGAFARVQGLRDQQKEAQ